MRLEDLTQWLDSLLIRRYSQNTISLKVSVVKSLFAYAHRIGYLDLNATAAMKAPSQVNALHERILEGGWQRFVNFTVISPSKLCSD